MMLILVLALAPVPRIVLICVLEAIWVLEAVPIILHIVFYLIVFVIVEIANSLVLIEVVVGGCHWLVAEVVGHVALG